MTTATMQTTAHPQRTAPGFGSVLASEWVKLRSVRATYSSKRPVASRSRSYRLVSGNGGNQDSRRMVQIS